MNKNNLNKNIYGIEKGIIELKYKDFIISKNKIKINNDFFDNKGLIVFYAPWRKHCQGISTDLINLSNDNLYIFPIGAVNIEDIKNENHLLSKKAKIKQIPTIKYINSKGYLLDYKYDINIDNLKYFINMNL